MMRTKVILTLVLYLSFFGTVAAFYPVDLTTELNGLEIDVQTSTIDTEFQPEKITLVHFTNSGTVSSECKSTFNAGVQQPKTVTTIVKGGEKSLARHVTHRDITRMRVQVLCMPLESNQKDVD